MPIDLIITASTEQGTAEFRLLDDAGNQQAYRQTDFRNISVSRQRGLFDLRDHLRNYVEDGREQAVVRDIGVCIAEDVLGQDIFKRLWKSDSQRTLRIQLPGAEDENNHLASALARVPWEIARPDVDQPTLGERNLLVRVVHDMHAAASQPLQLADNEPLRVLFVFAQALGSAPLGARRERRDLLDIFRKEIYPQRQVVAHFLTHGVTRERLTDQIQEYGGYHVVHWSGHGHLNLLELARPGGKSDVISGQDLLGLFKKAGGFLPRLFFLSACHSGEIARVKDWVGFFAVAQGREPDKGTKDGTGAEAGAESGLKKIDLEEQPGFTGTAHALLQGGVPSVVAMRYAVGDEYARELGIGFYRALLAHPQPKNVAAALTMARQSLLDGQKFDLARFHICDHATPVLYGEEQPGLVLTPGRSPDLNPPNPRLHDIIELNTASHEHFVGRTWELTGLGSDFIGSRAGDETRPVAVITGLGGMGKTALVAESLALWQTRFDWVLLYQAKPNALGFDATLRDIDLKLRGELGRYHDHVKQRPADAIYRDATADFTGPERLKRLTKNLVRALQDEAILLVLDNFETNLKPTTSGAPGEPTASAVGSHPTASSSTHTSVDTAGTNRTADAVGSPGVSPVWSCQDPAWDYCLRTLARELQGTRSRVLITCRRPLAALSGEPTRTGEPTASAVGSHPTASSSTNATIGSRAPNRTADAVGSPGSGAFVVGLGPLPAGEAALYLRAHPALSRLLYSAEQSDRLLAMRLLNASRFHPLLMDRLAKLAGQPDLRPRLLQALDTLEQSKGYGQLPELFATNPGDAKELAYLDDALATSLDQLIQQAGPNARLLLWIIALANEPVTLGLLTGVWSGEEDPQKKQLRQIKQLFDMLPELPPEMQEKLKAMPPELRAMLNALPPESAAERPAIGSLLEQLVSVGLATQEHDAPDDANPLVTCHELVRERITAWMEQHPSDQSSLTPASIRLAYAARLEAVFTGLMHQNMTAALQAGSQAVVYCVQAEAWDRLGSFASRLVTSAQDPRLLQGLVPHLQTAAESAPEGRPRWSCLCYLADALKNGGRPDASLPFYEQAALQALSVAEAGGEDSRQGWSDFAAITGNQANALGDCGHLDAARQRQLDSAEAERKAGQPEINVIGSELEALRIDIIQGQVDKALPEVETRLARIEIWWKQHRAGQTVPEAPDAEFLSRVFIGALDIAKDADFAREDWESALGRLDQVLQVKRDLNRPDEDIASDRTNRANVLNKLDRFAEARTELEACLETFRNNPTNSAKVLSSLADLFNKQGDVPQAITQQRRALALCEKLPDPADRAISHNNLGNYLERSGNSSDLAETPRHQLAALVYFLAADVRQHVQTLLRNYAISFRRAHAAGTELTVPRLAKLLNDPAFEPLEQWLRQRQVDPDELQTAIDQLLTQVRQAARDDVSGEPRA